MKIYTSKERVIIEAAGVLLTKQHVRVAHDKARKITKAEALTISSKAVDRLFGSVDSVDESRVAPFINALLRAQWAREDEIDLNSASFAQSAAASVPVAELARLMDLAVAATPQVPVRSVAKAASAVPAANTAGLRVRVIKTA